MLLVGTMTSGVHIFKKCMEKIGGSNIPKLLVDIQLMQDGTRLVKCLVYVLFRVPDIYLIINKDNSNVIMIYSSAPCYPQGVIDPIESCLALLHYGIHLN
jgi:hypothetical protein